MNKVPNSYYENFVKYLNQNEALLGTQSFNPAEQFFDPYYDAPKWVSTDQNITSAECVYNTDDDECSMPVSVVWKFVFAPGRNYWRKTRWEEKTVYFDFYGYNRSHEGRTYEGWREVQPKTKTVEVFE